MEDISVFQNLNFLEIVSGTFDVIYYAAFFVVPIVLAYGLWKAWITYNRAIYIAEQDSILLEVKLPREITKSPFAMEVILAAFYQTGGEGTFIDRWFKGKTRPWFSFELVSLGGEVHFFMWTRPDWKNHIESQIYAQYSGVEVYEVPDYVPFFSLDTEENDLWGCDFKLSKPDPYPIKSYVDYGLDQNPKEEEKIDPLTPLLEYLGSVREGQQVWLQIVFRAHKKERKPRGQVFTFKRVDWTEEAKKEIEKILKEGSPHKADPEGNPPKFGDLSEGQQNTVKAIERSIAKYAFDCGIRGIYIAEDKTEFDPTKIAGLTGAFKQFDSKNLNGFQPTRGLTEFSYPWQDYKNRRKIKAKKKILDAYKRRSFFYAPYKYRPFVLNTEELATIYHFPGSVADVPTFSRIESRKAEPPSHLPG